MKNFSRIRKFLTVGFTAFALTAGFFASVSPSHASRYICDWTPRGTMCHQ